MGRGGGGGELSLKKGKKAPNSIAQQAPPAGLISQSISFTVYVLRG